MNHALLGIVLAVGASSGAAAASNPQKESSDWHKKSDIQKGVDQATVTKKQGRVYANPDRQKALDDAMKSDRPTPTPTAAPKPAGTPR